MRIITSLKYPLADGTRARPLEYQIKSRPAILAAQGEEGIIAVEDYRGVPVLAAYRYLDLKPEVGLGLVVKRDQKEVFAPLRESIFSSATIGAGALILVTVSTILLANRLSRPIHNLSSAAWKVEAGDLDARAPVSGPDEVRAMAETFNSMIQRLQGWHKGLEEQVKNRTFELSLVNQELTAEVTRRTRIERRLRRMTDDLKRSNAELQQFAYVASHDLQEPLRMVASYTELLAKRYQGRLDADADDFIKFALEGATRMSVLIENLLMYSRVETQEIPLEPTECESVLEQALANLQMVVEDTGAVVTHDVLPTVVVKASQLVQLFQNLISNSIKFQGKDPPRVHISAERKEDEWVFSVRDNGIGIDPRHHERIFIIFQRLHDRTEFTGTGIGLAISKKVVETHGGRIWIESQPGEGAVFYFTIPTKGEKNHYE